MFKKRYVVTFFLKSGNKLTFTCDSITIKNNSDGGLASYDITNVKMGDMFFCDIKEIEAITFKAKYAFWS